MEKLPFSKRLKELFRTSIFWTLLCTFSNWIYNGLQNGLFGRLFTGYDRAEAQYRTGFLARGRAALRMEQPRPDLTVPQEEAAARAEALKGSPMARLQQFFRWLYGALRRVRRAVARGLEGSFLAALLGRLKGQLLGCRLRVYGAFLLTYGSYTALVCLLRALLTGDGGGDSFQIVEGVLFMLAALPCFFTRRTLSQLLRSGRIFRFLLLHLCGVQEERLDVPQTPDGGRMNVAIFAGMAAGLLTYFVTPLYLPLLLFWLIATVIIFAVPESGIVLLVGVMPFLGALPIPSVVLLLALLTIGFSYLLKLVTGKRVFRLRLLDLAVLLFGALILFGGIISVGGSSSYHSAILSCGLLLGYFLIVNLLRTRVWIGRTVAMLVVSGVFVALYGIWQYFATDIGLEWLDTEMFTNITGRSTGTFDNANVFAVYLVLLLPFAFQFFVRAGELRRGIVYGFACTMLLTALVLTWSRGAWLGAIAALLLFFLFVSRRTVNWLLLGGLTLPLWSYVLPDNLLHRFLSIGNLQDSSTHYRYYLWKGVADAIGDHWFGGIGYGESAFQAIYPVYAYAGIESAPHAHNLFLQIFLCLGVGGLLTFLGVTVLFLKESLGYLRQPVNRLSGLYTAAGFAAVVGALVIGLTDYVWYNYRLFFLFWAVLALTVASVRAGEEEREKAAPYYENSETSADVDLPAGGSHTGGRERQS